MKRKIKQSGIYKIECLVNKKVYIGSSVDIESRLTWHKSKLKNGIHSNKDLQEDVNMYGLDNFTFTTIIFAEEDILDILEEEIILKFRAVECGYNATKKANGRYKKTNIHKDKIKESCKNRVFTDEHRKHLSQATNEYIKKYGTYSKKVMCLETGKIFNSIKEAKLNTGATGIGECINGNLYTSGKLHWCLVGQEKSIEKHTHGKCKCLKCLNTNEIFVSVKEASNCTGCNISGISECCNKKQKYTKNRNNERMYFEYL